ncbi:sensor histidine kinase KdpD (plasmid) [Lichenicola cladoniae]|uniref:histidine kinase n=1 Tax=Lichenicola cladoniae TaxID=1484109 RepID=A0A6M8I089_9PROT|nr:sensor histidine kinase KdpD [Lichenicola cladoniae]QKE93856.1 sensor histidine kinase KdpD [Lichenicola cladoniae]
MRNEPDRRPDPDALLAAQAKASRAPLKIFLGAAPGVGKTFEMLTQARRLLAENKTGILAGLIETHGRAETEAQLGDLPVLPRLQIPYRGQMLEEFDLEEALALRPSLLLVDELAHSNAPGSRHARRWEDVAELLVAGIPVWTTLNVQHLESLNDTVLRITGIRVSETLPDHVLELADEIELIDLSPNDLRARLVQGRIYRPDVATRALGGFFREGNLQALREIALRRAAQHVDAGLLDYMRLNAIDGPWPAGDRVLALVGPEAGEPVLREAKRLADALHAPWLALHVEPAGEVPQSTQAVSRIMALAAELGAETEIRAVRSAREGIVGIALDVAHDRNVTQIVVGRMQQRTLLRRMVAGRCLRGNLAATLLSRAPEHAVHVVPTGAPALRRFGLRASLPDGWQPWVVSSLLVACTLVLAEMLRGLIEPDALGMLFLASVVGAAALYGLAVALCTALVSFLAWNFFFIRPLYQFTIDEPRDLMAIVVFGTVAGATGLVASRLGASARAAQGRIEGLRRIGAFSRALGGPVTENELQDEIARQAASIAARAMVLAGRDIDGELDIRAAVPPADTMDEGSWAAALWAWRHGEPAGRGTATLPSAPWRFLPIGIAGAGPEAGTSGLRGLLAVQPATALDAPALQALQALADQAAVALERVRLVRGAADATARNETQKLRTALLNSLSHDLRTPLTGIRGSAETLRTAWSRLTPDTRDDLLLAIEEDTLRMTRFLANITDMTRLESGAVVPKLVRVDPQGVVQDAIARFEGPGLVAISKLGMVPAVLADPLLLEQVVFNVLDNALKYSPTPAPGPAPNTASVQVVLALETGNVVIRIADAGSGIPEADLPNVFDSFYRSQHGDRVVPGTGLGLAIARGLIEVMGGSISASSPVPAGVPGIVSGIGRGTLVSIVMPAIR